MTTPVVLLIAWTASVAEAFFFGGSNCGCGCPAPPRCAPTPTCAIPLPCGSSALPAIPAISASPSYQGSWAPAIPAFPSYSQPFPSYSPSYSQSFPSFSPPSYASYPSYESVTHRSPPPFFPALLPPPPAPVLPTLIPATPPPQVMVLATKYPPSYLTSEPAPFSYNYDRMVGITATLQPSSQFLHSGYASGPMEQFDDATYQSTTPSSFDEMAPVPPPPPPPTGDSFVTAATLSPQAQVYDYRTDVVDTPSSIKSGFIPGVYSSDETTETSFNPHETSWPVLPSATRKISTEGLSSMSAFEKRHNVLKRMKNTKEDNSSVPRTNNTCNSMKLANIMARVIVEDVSVAKRMILHATQLAFDGAKFDVFCATGEFSYSIHSRKYCEVTKDSVTCFAFR